MAQYYKKITAKKSFFNLKLKEVWRYRDLIMLFTRRHFVLFYKQTILGPLWTVIHPLLSSLLYMLVFGNIAKLSTDGVPQLLFYFAGTAIWEYYSTCVTQNADTFRANSQVFGKVYFPRLTVSISNVLSSIIQFGIQMIVVLGLTVYFTIIGLITPNWALFPLLIPLLMVVGLLGMGFGIIISSMTTKYRDLSILVTFGVTLWMYATPIVYPASSLGTGLMSKLIWYNPVTAPVEVFRYIVLGVGQINLFGIIYSLAATLVVAIFGIAVFNRVEKNFMDTI